MFLTNQLPKKLPELFPKKKPTDFLKIISKAVAGEIPKKIVEIIADVILKEFNVRVSKILNEFSN